MRRNLFLSVFGAFVAFLVMTTPAMAVVRFDLEFLSAEREPIQNVPFEIRRVSTKAQSVSGRGGLVVDAEAFGGYASPLGIETSDDMQVTSEALLAFAQQNGIAPDATSVTDASGHAYFDGLMDGVYLVSAKPTEQVIENEDGSKVTRTWSATPFLAFVPENTEASPKPILSEVSESPLLDIQKDVDATQEVGERQFAYKIVIKQLVDGAVSHDVTLVDDLPDGFSFDHMVSIDGVSDPVVDVSSDGNSYTVHLGDLAFGDEVSLVYVATYAEGTEAGEHVNVASVTDSEGNRDEDDAIVEIVVPDEEPEPETPGLNVQKDADVSVDAVEGEYGYMVRIWNPNEGTVAKDVRFTDTLPEHFSYDRVASVRGLEEGEWTVEPSSDGSSFTFSFSELPYGTDVFVSYVTRISSDCPAGSHINTVTASADGVPDVSDDATVITDEDIPLASLPYMPPTTPTTPVSDVEPQNLITIGESKIPLADTGVLAVGAIALGLGLGALVVRFVKSRNETGDDE